MAAIRYLKLSTNLGDEVPVQGADGRDHGARMRVGAGDV